MTKDLASEILIRRSKRNRITILDSLRGFVGLLFCERKEQFEYYYKVACHDSGTTIWNYIQREEKKMKDKLKKLRDYMADGVFPAGEEIRESIESIDWALETIKDLKDFVLAIYNESNSYTVEEIKALLDL